MRKGEHKGRRVAGGRGLYDFGRVVDSRGTSVTVRRSSAAGTPSAWLFVKDREGREVVEHMGLMTGVSPHLSRADARRLAEALLRFAESP